MEYLEAGKVCNVHGLKGIIKVQPWTDAPEIFEIFEYVYIDNIKYKVEHVSYKKPSVLLKLEGVDDANKGLTLKDKIVMCTKADFGDINDNTYFVADIIGCMVYQDNDCLGAVTDVIPTGSTDVYEITDKDKTSIYLPAIKENILKIEISNKKIYVKLPEGLI